MLTRNTKIQGDDNHDAEDVSTMQAHLSADASDQSENKSHIMPGEIVMAIAWLAFYVVACIAPLTSRFAWDGIGTVVASLFK